MTDLFWICLGLLGAWSLGTAAASLLSDRTLTASPGYRTGKTGPRAEVAGLGCVLGIALTSYLQFLWCLVGGKLGRECSLTLATGGIVAGILVWSNGRRKSSRTPVHTLDEGSRSQEADQNLCRFSLAVICLIFLSAFIQTLLTPQRYWDERAYYGLKAIVLFEDHTIFTPDLLEADFAQGHPRYPLMISLAEQHLYALLGRVDDRWSKVIFPMLFAGLVLVFGGVLSRHRHPNFAWLGALMLATLPVLMPDNYGFLSGQADAPVACLEGVAVLYVWDALSRISAGSDSISRSLPSLMIAALATGFAGFTKDEGISYWMNHILALAGALIAWQLSSRAARARVPFTLTTTPARDGKVMATGVLILAVIPGLVLVPWFLHRRHLPLTGEMNYFSRVSVSALWSGLQTLNWSIPHLARRMFAEPSTWGLQWWLLIMMLALFPRRAVQPAQLFLLLSLIGALAALLVAGMVAPVELHEHLGGSSHRYLMQIAPAALLFSLGQFGLPDKSSVKG